MGDYINMSESLHIFCINVNKTEIRKKKKKKVYLTVNTWFGRPPLRPHMVAGIEATHLTVQLLCKSGIQYVFEMIKYTQSETRKLCSMCIR